LSGTFKTFCAGNLTSSAVVAHGFYKSNIQPGMTVAVMGCGSIGLLAIQWARIFGAAHIIAIDIDNNPILPHPITATVIPGCIFDL
jgi:Zn-dependent alcohol dehydrogenase